MIGELGVVIALILLLAASGARIRRLPRRWARYWGSIILVAAPLGVLTLIDPLNELIKALATAGDADKAAAALGAHRSSEWALDFATNDTRARWALLLDFGFIVAYTGAVGIGMWSTAPDARLFRSRRLVTVAIAGIALLDLVENTALLGFLAERPLDPVLVVLPVVYWIKLVGGAACVVTALILGRPGRRQGRASR